MPSKARSRPISGRQRIRSRPQTPAQPLDENGQPRRKRRRRRGRRGGRDRDRSPRRRERMASTSRLCRRSRTVSAPCRTRSTPRPADARHAPGAPSAPVWSLKDDIPDTTPKTSVQAGQKGLVAEGVWRRISAARNLKSCKRPRILSRPFLLLLLVAIFGSASTSCAQGRADSHQIWRCGGNCARSAITPDAQVVGLGAHRVGGIDRRTAIAAKSLGAAVAAFGGLHIDLGRALSRRKSSTFAGTEARKAAPDKSGNRTQWQTADARRIDLGLIGDGAAMTGAMNYHCAPPLRPPRPAMGARIGQRHAGRLVAGNHVDRVIGRRAGAAQVAALAQVRPPARRQHRSRWPPPCRRAARAGARHGHLAAAIAAITGVRKADARPAGCDGVMPSTTPVPAAVRPNRTGRSRSRRRTRRRPLRPPRQSRWSPDRAAGGDAESRQGLAHRGHRPRVRAIARCARKIVDHGSGEGAGAGARAGQMRRSARPWRAERAGPAAPWWPASSPALMPPPCAAE